MNIRSSGTSSSKSCNLHFSMSTGASLQFPEGCSFKPTNPGNEYNGLVKVFDNNGLLFAKLNYQNGKLNGISHFYENAILFKSITFVNDKMDGWCTEHGKEQFYRDDKLVSELSKNDKLEGYMNEIDINTKKVLRCCKFDESHKPVGIGSIFENGILTRIVLFGEGNEDMKLKEIEGKEMTEYNENGEVIYKGECKVMNWLEVVREGKGIEYVNDEPVYVGMWKNDKREGEGKSIVEGEARYDGMWINGLPNGKGRMYDKNGKVILESEWVNGKGYVNEYEWYDYESGERNKDKRGCFGLCLRRARVEKLVVRSEHDLNNLNNQVTELVVDKGVCNDMKGDLVIENLNCLKSILVKKNSMKNLNSLTIENNLRLESIVTENGVGGYDRTDSKNTGAFYYVNSVIIRSLIDLIQFI